MNRPMHASEVDRHSRIVVPFAPLDTQAMTVRCKIGVPIYTCGEPDGVRSGTALTARITSESAPARIGVLIAHGSPLISAGLASVFTAQPDFDVFCCEDNGCPQRPSPEDMASATVPVTLPAVRRSLRILRSMCGQLSARGVILASNVPRPSACVRWAIAASRST